MDTFGGLGGGFDLASSHGRLGDTSSLLPAKRESLLAGLEAVQMQVNSGQMPQYGAGPGGDDEYDEDVTMLQENSRRGQRRSSVGQDVPKAPWGSGPGRRASQLNQDPERRASTVRRMSVEELEESTNRLHTAGNKHVPPGKLMSQYPEDDPTPRRPQTRPFIPPCRDGIPIWERGAIRAKERETALRAERRRQSEQEASLVTGFPKINNKSRALARTKSVDQWMGRRERKLQDLHAQLAAQQCQECTFRPHLNTRSLRIFEQFRRTDQNFPDRMVSEHVKSLEKKAARVQHILLHENGETFQPKLSTSNFKSQSPKTAGSVWDRIYGPSPHGKDTDSICSGRGKENTTVGSRPVTPGGTPGVRKAWAGRFDETGGSSPGGEQDEDEEDDSGVRRNLRSASESDTIFQGIKVQQVGYKPEQMSTLETILADCAEPYEMPSPMRGSLFGEEEGTTDAPSPFKKRTEEERFQLLIAGINWQAVRRKLTYDRALDAREQRRKFFDALDEHGSGQLSFTDIDQGIRAVLGLDDIFDTGPAIACAFNVACSDAEPGQQCFVQRKEFRILLQVIWHFLELSTMFDCVGNAEIKRIMLPEFASRLPEIVEWGVKIDMGSAESVFDEIAEGHTHAGVVTFSELAACLIRKLLRQDDE